jgi:ATP-dependent RNA helicase DDX31/DBP7
MNNVVTFDDEEIDPFERGVGDHDENNNLQDGGELFSVHLFKLHGNMGQVDRAAVFHAFRSSSDQGILFCTDVAARGLDMANVDWIVHYDPPSDERCYIHRVGRTARLGRVGDSILFLLAQEVKYADFLSKFIRMPIAEKKCEAFLFYLTKLDHSSNHNWMQSCATLERKICQCVREDLELGRIALFAYQSFVRAYAGFSRPLKQYFKQEELHLGHVANSFGIDAKPSELRRKMQAEKVMKDERSIGRDTSRFAKQGSRMELADKTTYHSAMAHKQVKVSKDWLESQREQKMGQPKTASFTEFDAE